jgi:hypothetical protein
MRVEILKAVLVLGQVKRSGTFDVPDETAKHWIATGAAKAAPSLSASVSTPLPTGSGKKGL